MDCGLQRFRVLSFQEAGQLSNQRGFVAGRFLKQIQDLTRERINNMRVSRALVKEK